MGDKIDIYKITLDFLKGNKVFLYLVTTAVTSGLIGHFVPPLMKTELIPTIISAPTPVIIKQQCTNCDEEIKRLKVEIEKLKSEDKKLKRWHGG